MMRPPLKMRRVLFDVTSTVDTDHVTGIQRVVLSLEKQMRALCKERGVEFEAIYFNGRDYSYCKMGTRHRFWSKRRIAGLMRRLRKSVLFSLKIVGGIFWVALCILPRAMRPDCDPARIEARLTNFCKRGSTFAFSFARRVLGCLPLPSFMRLSLSWQPRRGDVFLLADATWNYTPWAKIDAVREAGVSVHTIVYDLLPLKHPSFFQPKLVQLFDVWWKRSIKHSSSFMCISESVKTDVEHYLKKEEKETPAFVFPLGYEFSQKLSETIDDAVIPAMPIDWARDIVFLAVGTLEPRKNHDMILDAMDRVWKKSTSHKLILVGRKGWLSEKLVDRIQNHPHLGTHLFWNGNCSDALLEKLYKASDCLIAASYDEGYGLPIIEAAARGVPALVSDIPVFREVSCESTRFFDLDDDTSLVRAIEHTEKKSVSVETTFPSWSDAAKKVFLSLRHAARFAVP